MLRPEVSAARRLRREMSLSEVLLWQRLRDRGDRPSFRRQHPIGPYVADFYCPAARLVIEIDGEVHADTARIAFDDRRDQFLQENGYQVLRFTAADVLKDVDAAANAIVSLAALPLHPQPAAGGPPPRAGEDF
ncbi:endonuclease domain-containing protein [Sphingomonas suaedae]|uniref:Endonuclease domain-containing protein n=2 Tax=Sphingomonas suaedae TaxID=2599297 RepID=A0A518RL83_9SPHN|nr:endonuclease domain-containing protein [Sphingomonas suaedae]